MSGASVVLNRTTIGYVDYQPAGRFYQARIAAPDVTIGAFPTAHEARKAVFDDRSARQAEMKRRAPRAPAGTKPVFRGTNLIGWIAPSGGAFEAVSLPCGEITGPFETERDARKVVNAAWGRSRTKLGPAYGIAARRRGELVRLALHFKKHGRPLETYAMALVMADSLVFSLTGADYPAFGEFAKRCGLTFDEGPVMVAIKRVTRVAGQKGRSYRPFAARAVARLLGVTLADKKELALRTIAAMDETPEQQKERQRTGRREYERERSRRRRAERGAVPHEQSVTRTRPWVAAGVSRSTWYARKAASEAPVSESAEKATPAKPYRRQEAAGHFRPLTKQGRRGSAAAAVEPVQPSTPREPQATMRAGGDGSGRLFLQTTTAQACPCGEAVERKLGASPAPSSPAARAANAGLSGEESAERYGKSARVADLTPAEVISVDPDMITLRRIVNRVRWDCGLPTKLSIDEIVRMVAAQATEIEEDEEAAEESEREALRARYDAMGDETLSDQLHYSDAVSFAEDLDDLLDDRRHPRRSQIRSRLIEYLLSRETNSMQHRAA